GVRTSVAFQSETVPAGHYRVRYHICFAKKGFQDGDAGARDCSVSCSVGWMEGTSLRVGLGQQICTVPPEHLAHCRRAQNILVNGIPGPIHKPMNPASERLGPQASMYIPFLIPDSLESASGDFGDCCGDVRCAEGSESHLIDGVLVGVARIERRRLRTQHNTA